MIWGHSLIFPAFPMFSLYTPCSNLWALMLLYGTTGPFLLFPLLWPLRSGSDLDSLWCESEWRFFCACRSWIWQPLVTHQVPWAEPCWCAEFGALLKHVSSLCSVLLCSHLHISLTGRWEEKIKVEKSWQLAGVCPFNLLELKGGFLFVFSFFNACGVLRVLR